MKKLLTTLFLCFLILPCLVISVSAQGASYVSDNAGLLTSEEITFLEEQASDLVFRYDIDPVILTVNSLDGTSAQNCADDHYDSNGYRDNGVLFLLAMEEREWYISTCGTVMYALTDYGIQEIGESIVPYLAEEQWCNGFSCFLSSLPTYLDAYESGSPIDGHADYSGDYYHGDQEEILYYEDEFTPSFFLSFSCGIILAGISILVMRFGMNTKHPQRSASEYIKNGSWKLHNHRDLFLYSKVTKTRRQETTSNSGGGSSVHRSTGGRRHGGGGGKF